MDFSLSEEQQAFRDMPCAVGWTPKRPRVGREQLERREEALSRSSSGTSSPRPAFTASASTRNTAGRAATSSCRCCLRANSPAHWAACLDLGSYLVCGLEVDRSLRHARAEAAIPAANRRRQVPRLHRIHRAGRRHRCAGRHADHAPSARAAVGSSTVRRCGVPRRTCADYILLLARTDKNVTKSRHQG